MKFLFISLTVLFLQSQAFCSDFFVVFNNGNKVFQKKMTKDEVKSIFLGYQLYLDGNRIHPLQLSPESPSMEIFLKNILGMNARDYSSYWRRKLFSGKGTPPKVFNDQAEMLIHIKRHENSIGILPMAPTEEAQIIIIPGDDLVDHPFRNSAVANHY